MAIAWSIKRSIPVLMNIIVHTKTNSPSGEVLAFNLLYLTELRKK
jgi:hypothetical protein